MKGKLSPHKAKEMLRHGEARGHKLTRRQKGYFGRMARNAATKTPTRTQDFYK